MNPTVHSRHRRLPALLVLVVVALIGVACGSDPDSDSGGAGEASVFGIAPPGGTVARGEPGAPLPQFDSRSPDLARGLEIPEVSGRTITGDEITIGPDGAKVIVFLAHWCPHCQAEVPRIVEHLKGTPMPDDVELVGVATSTNANSPFPLPAEWLADEQWTAPTLDDTDNTVAAMYGLSSFPYFVAVDAEGTVVARGSGELSTDQFDQLVRAASTGSL